MAGPLTGIRIVEIAAIGPAPFAAMMLADHGAQVVRVERPGGARAGLGEDPRKDVLARTRKSIVVDLKQSCGVDIVRALCRTADGFIEGFRPGVMERLGLAPEVLLADNPALVYGRMTGWGQSGPLARAAGHDINYIALSGNLHGYGRPGGKPTPPANAVGDFGGGGMMLAFAMVSAILHARSTGRGQVVDCAMVDGAAVLSSMIWSLRGMGMWRDERGVNVLDSGAHFYETYETADGKYVSVGAIEPAFYAELRRRAGLESDPEFDAQQDPHAWPRLKEKLAAVFRTRTREQWCALMEGTDACFAPVLSMQEAPRHPHNAARGTFIDVHGTMQPAPAPRYSVTSTATPTAPRSPGEDTDAVLAGLGYAPERIAALRARGVVGG